MRLLLALTVLAFVPALANATDPLRVDRDYRESAFQVYDGLLKPCYWRGCW